MGGRGKGGDGGGGGGVWMERVREVVGGRGCKEGGGEGEDDMGR